MFKTLDVGDTVTPAEGKGRRRALRLPRRPARVSRPWRRQGLADPLSREGSAESLGRPRQQGVCRAQQQRGASRPGRENPGALRSVPWSLRLSTGQHVCEGTTWVHWKTHPGVRENRPQCSHMVGRACYHQLDQKPSSFTGPWRECTEGSWHCLSTERKSMTSASTLRN